MKKFLSFLIVGLLVLVLSACGSNGSSDDSSGNDSGGDDALSKIKDKGTITVGFSNEAPYAYKDDDGNLTGAAVEVARAVFKEMGIDKMDGKLMDYGQLIPGVKTGKLDVITAGMAITPDRCEQVDFAHPSIIYGEGIIVPEGNPKDLHSYEDIKDKDVKVAVLNSGTEHEFLTKVGVDDSKITAVEKVSDGVQAVKTGRADVTTATEETVKKAMKDSGDSDLEYVEDFTQPDIEGVPSYGAEAFKKGNDKLREEYNKTLDKMRDDGKIKDIVTDLPLWDEDNVWDGSPETDDICSGDEY